jgi:hypothetical protein
MSRLRHAKAARTLFALLLLLTSSVVYRPSSTVAQQQTAFVTVQGNQLMLRGVPIKLKGTNFYPKDRPWADMWKKWNGPETRADLSRAREIGVNSVRILVPYKPVNGWTNKDSGAVTPEYLDRLRQMVQLAGELDMKVIIALFDFYDPEDDRRSGMQASETEARNLRYLRDIVPTFANDDRVLAWDLHNEPEHYKTWLEEKKPQVTIAWMARMAAEIRRLDSNHLLTVGMADYKNLFTADDTGAPYEEEPVRGLTPADLSDFLSWHSYNAGDMDWQIRYIRAHSNKPLVLQETGWPSGPACTAPEYNEQHQTFLYNTMVDWANKGNLSGLMQWQLWDLPLGASVGAGRESYEDFFGLLRRDGSWKAAMPVFRDGWKVEPLPSATRTDLPLTVFVPNPTPPDPTYQPPLYFPETGKYNHAEFRDYWRRFGGLAVFGYPITDQRQEGDLWVQYFERARFEFHPEVRQKVKDFDKLDKPQQYKLIVQLTRLGADLVDQRTGGKGFPLPDRAALPANATVFHETGHSLSGKIADYWWANNGLTNFGFPLSEPVQEVSQADGKTYTVQYFERTRLEYHPEHAGTPYEIMLGLLGREKLASKGCR